MDACSRTDIGRKRAVNQDYVFSSTDAVGELPNLFVVADGMGGHNAGEFASKFCVETFVQKVSESPERTVIGRIEKAISETNYLLREKAAEDESLSGMGTTFVVCTVCDNTVYAANIGDSRLYLIEDGDISQITVDHSLVEEMVRNGEIDRREARFHPNKNVITRALGVTKNVIPDFFELTGRPGSILLLCSDGLSNMVEDEEIKRIVTAHSDDIQGAVDVLIDRANENGGRDNIAIVIVKL
ncbi:MAG: Stp1/IreP family PP2C-type Ser/Thr phosphatase [Lachnospiraceae bacterium]|nr:Stp1/IreP family PP2C-type Ser/Thr phosphatase [Lachnospiraceae bacterium]